MNSKTKDLVDKIANQLKVMAELDTEFSYVMISNDKNARKSALSLSEVTVNEMVNGINVLTETLFDNIDESNFESVVKALNSIISKHSKLVTNKSK